MRMPGAAERMNMRDHAGRDRSDGAAGSARAFQETSFHRRRTEPIDGPSTFRFPMMDPADQAMLE